MDDEKLFGLVACSKTKRETDEKIEARKRYDESWLFRARRRAVEEWCVDWGIMSAKYAYLSPVHPIPYYDRNIAELSDRAVEKLADATVRDLRDRAQSVGADGVMILAGRDYADPVKERLEETPLTVYDPLEGVRLFNQKSELEKLTERAKPTTQTGLDQYE